MKKWLFAVLFGAALVLGACGGGDEDASSDNGEASATGAEEIYESNCASCHGQDLTGSAGPDLTSIGSDYSADEIVDIIQNGTGTMQPQNVPDEDANTLASWLADKK